MARADGAIALQAADGHGDIVDGAEALAVVREGVMESAAEVEAQTVFQSQARGQDGAAGGQPESFHHLARIGDLQAQNVLVAQGAVAQLGDPLGDVHQQDVFVRGGGRLDEILGRGETRADQAVVQPAVFLGGEDVRAEVQVVALGVDQAEGQHRRLDLLRLQSRHHRHVEDILGRATAREIVGRLGEALQEGADGGGAAQPFHQLVAYIGGGQAGEDQSVGAAGHWRPGRFRLAY